MLDLSQNYFALFGLPLSFPIDEALLAERYRALQRSVHPDRFANADGRQRRLAVQGAALINEAYETLKNPMLRGRYLLRQLGVVMDEMGETTRDTAFLMEQLEWREALAEARQQPDPLATTTQLHRQTEQASQQWVTQLTQLFADPTPAELEQAREGVRKLQFLQKLHRDIEALEEALDV